MNVATCSLSSALPTTCSHLHCLPNPHTIQPQGYLLTCTLGLQNEGRPLLKETKSDLATWLDDEGELCQLGPTATR